MKQSHSIRCLIVDDEPVARAILEQYVGRLPDLIHVGSCKSSAEAKLIIAQDHVDLLFLDINMPDESGLALAKQVGGEVQVIFTTAYREYALDGFDLAVVDYLLKPIAFERFAQAVAQYRQRYSDSQRAADYLYVRADRMMVKVHFAEIRYIEAMSDYVRIFLGDRKTVMSRLPISQIEELLPREGFCRIHRSYIVARSQITAYTKESVQIGERALPVSRGYRGGFAEWVG